MLRRIRTLLFILIAAIVGAALGRVAAEVRRKQEAGEDPADVDISSIRIRPADLVPGLVAAVRVHDQPWSWLRIPSWLAAFAVNLGVAAVGGDLSRLREMAERAAFGLTGVDLSGNEDGDDSYDSYYRTYEAPAPATPANGPGGATWTVAGDDPPATDSEPPPSGGFTAFRD